MRSYRLITGLISPLIFIWLHLRKLRGKEDPVRIKERFGIASKPRMPGILLWLHAASVGEANSVLLLIEKIRVRFPQVQLLLTTGTVTSAKLMGKRLPKDVIHQYAPVDTPGATHRFMKHWKPNFAFWIESEFWPNLVLSADEYQCFMGVINARMSRKSYSGWLRFRSMIRTLLTRFNFMFAQSEEDALRLELLGAKEVMCVGNLKYDAALLPCDEAELVKLKNIVAERPLWLAASTHPGEEAMIAEAHKTLAARHPNLLTVIVPRHPKRGAEIAASLKQTMRVAQRSKQEIISADTQIYIADTLGELGLFYRLCEIVFMGGSLVARGGQNPLEAARLACAIVTGTHTENFLDIYAEMETIGGCLRAPDAPILAAQINTLLSDPAMLDNLQSKARQWVESKGGAANRMLDMLAPVFEPTKKAS